MSTTKDEILQERQDTTTGKPAGEPAGTVAGKPAGEPAGTVADGDEKPFTIKESELNLDGDGTAAGKPAGEPAGTVAGGDEKPFTIKESELNLDGDGTAAGTKKRTPHMDSFLEMNMAGKPRTKEQVADDERRARSRKILAAIGDGLSALSNMVSTNRGAPSSFDPSKGMTAATQARYDMLRKEREANEKAYNAAYLRAQQMDMQEELNRQRMEAAERRQLAQERQHYDRMYERRREFDEEQARKNQEAAQKRELEEKKLAAKSRTGKKGRSSSSGTKTTTVYNPDGTPKRITVTEPGKKVRSSVTGGTLLPGNSGGTLLPKK